MTNTVWIYVDTSKEVGDKERVRTPLSSWLQENDPEGVAFEYEAG